MAVGWVYFMTNRPNGTLYVGVTDDLIRRTWEHREGVAEGFTKRYGLKRLVHFEQYEDIRDARQRERNLKHYSRAWKVRLILLNNPEWIDLFDDITGARGWPGQARPQTIEGVLEAKETGDIVFGCEGAVATVLLNRPQALNAFTLGMYRAFDPMLRTWADDPAVRAVLVRGAGDRAFCAGGDVRAVYEAGRGISGDTRLTSAFFWEEYELIRRLHRYAKPYLAVIDGITMGGGAGVSVNGAYRIATEKTMLAMPETAIGLFPDVGATRFLNLCPGRIGRYLGLTGVRLGPADALYCGFATHFVLRDRVPALVDALSRMAWQHGGERAQVDQLLAAFVVNPGDPPLAERRAAIDRCFAGDTIEAILDALAAEGGDWAAQTTAGLLTKSPTSLKVTLRQLIEGEGCDIEGALTLEYRLTQHFMAGHDFYEGVRAALVDKDQKPVWQPATLAGVTDAMVDGYFASLGGGELRFSE